MSGKEGAAARGKRILDRIDAQERETAKKFDPAKLIEDSARILTVQDPVLGEIKYTVLTTQNMFEISECTTAVERTKQTMFRLLHKAYPKLKSPDDILKLPAQTVVRLGEILDGSDNFFQIPKLSKPGSTQTKTPNTSA